MRSRALARPSLPPQPWPMQAHGPAAQIGRECRAWTSKLLDWRMRDTAPVPEWTQGRPRLDELGWGLGRNRDRKGVCSLADRVRSSAHDPNQYEAEHGRDDAGDPERGFRAFQRARRQPLRGAGKVGE